VKPRVFAYHQPRTLDEALELLAAGDDVAVLAGGQSLVPMMNARLASPEIVVDINRLSGLDAIWIDGDRLVVGALVRHETLVGHPLVLERLPLLSAMARTIAHWPIRTRGTIGGSLVHADPAAQWPLAAVLLEAELELESRGNARRVPAADFFEGALTTTLAAGELLTAIRFRLPDASHGAAFRLLARRPGDYAIAMAACLVEADRPRRLAIGGVEPRPLDRSAALGGLTTMPAMIEAACRDVAPMDDPRAPADYRRRVLPQLVGDCLAEALGRQAS
jgi:aerobic carbon-monoxide dehydrogenase medium subunit